MKNNQSSMVQTSKSELQIGDFKLVSLGGTHSLSNLSNNKA